jgi:hypothetical protein
VHRVDAESNRKNDIAYVRLGITKLREQQANMQHPIRTEEPALSSLKYCADEIAFALLKRSRASPKDNLVYKREHKTACKKKKKKKKKKRMK